MTDIEYVNNLIKSDILWLILKETYLTCHALFVKTQTI